jgi:hypothetical protein
MTDATNLALLAKLGIRDAFNHKLLMASYFVPNAPAQLPNPQFFIQFPHSHLFFQKKMWKKCARRFNLHPGFWCIFELKS